MILFITRKYPPSVGGMQELSYYLTTTIARRVSVQIIKWGRSQRWLPLFFICAFIQALWVLVTKPVDLIHIGDPVLAPLGLLLRVLGRLPVVVNAHGLDVIYPNRLYQAVIPACMRRLDFIVCISEYTRQQCLDRGIEAERTEVIPVGVDINAFKVSLTEKEQRYWLECWGIDTRPHFIFLTVGRLVPRKGVEFFISHVLSELAESRCDWVYIIVGDGPERQVIEAAIQNHGLIKQVIVLGRVPDNELQAAYAMADLFVMPNIPVTGDPEGFGIVTLEARASGLPVIASSMEGINDAFTSSEDSILVPPGNKNAFLRAIEYALEIEWSIEDQLRQRHLIEDRYSWTRIADKYLTVFRQTQKRYDLYD
jgi:glycosyltransferase involved in cell wall biosynthesis